MSEKRFRLVRGTVLGKATRELRKMLAYSISPPLSTLPNYPPRSSPSSPGQLLLAVLYMIIRPSQDPSHAPSHVNADRSKL